MLSAQEFFLCDHTFLTYEDDLESLAGPLTFRHPTSTSGALYFLFFVVWRCFTASRRRTFEWTLRSVSCMPLFVFACTSHAVSPRPGLVKLLALSNFPAFVHYDPCFTGLYGQRCSLLYDTLCHRCFLLPDRMRLLSPVSRTQWLLCADPPFFVHH